MTPNPVFVAIDTTDLEYAISLAGRVAPYVGGVKLGLDRTRDLHARIDRGLSRRDEFLRAACRVGCRCRGNVESGVSGARDAPGISPSGISWTDCHIADCRYPTQSGLA